MSLAVAASTIREWRENTNRFAWDNFGFTPDRWQKKLFDVFPSQNQEHIRIALQACAGPGKTAAMTICGWNFLSCYGDMGLHPKGACVSVTQDNLKDNLWPEFSKWQSRSEFLRHTFTWTKSRIYANDHPEDWFLSARSWSKSANAEEQGRTLSGIHSPFTLFIIDESGEIPITVLKAAEQAMSEAGGVFRKILQAGNPTSLEGMLHAAATNLRHLWYGIRITGDPDDPDRSPRISIEWAREQIETWGREDPWVMSYILGLFPPSSINTLLGPDEVAKAMARHLRPDQYEFSQKRLGIDVARSPVGDRTSIFPRQGLAAFRPVNMRGAKSHEIAARVISAKLRWGSEMEFIDMTGGYGAGVADCLVQSGYPPHEVEYAGKATDPRYANRRAQNWFRMAEWVRRGGALPPIPSLQRELTAPTYSFVKGKFLLEPKERIKARLGFSLDDSDALSQTFDIEDMPAELVIAGRSNAPNKHQSDYDPFDRD